MSVASRIGTNTGHGHAWARPDGVKMRCGGPRMCKVCATDAALVAGTLAAGQKAMTNPPTPTMDASTPEAGNSIGVTDASMDLEEQVARLFDPDAFKPKDEVHLLYWLGQDKLQATARAKARSAIDLITSARSGGALPAAALPSVTTEGQDAGEVAHSDALRMDYINSLPQPFFVKFGRDDQWWPVNDFEVSCALLRIDVCGLLQAKSFAEATEIQDGDWVQHDPETFWTDWAPPSADTPTARPEEAK